METVTSMGDPEGTYYTDDEIASMESDHEEVCRQVRFYQQGLKQIRTWVCLHRAGELTANGAFDQIELDVNRLLPQPDSTGEEPK